MDKERIKVLAKESLRDKWYPLRKKEKTEEIDVTDLNGACAFCSDADLRERSEMDACGICYIPKMTIDICDLMEIDNVERVIELLEQLAKNGELS